MHILPLSKHVPEVLAITALAACCSAWAYTAHPSVVLRRIYRRLQRSGWLGPTAREHEWQDDGVGMGMPECKPICTVDSFLSWQPPPLPKTGRPESSPLQSAAGQVTDRHTVTDAAAGKVTELHGVTDQRPRLLVCHDMKGGYLDDRFMQGSNDPDSYCFWQWDLVDVFVYFSHHLVTLPPPTWTQAAHKHGTLVLGTFITEWELGRQQCERMFESRESAAKVAEQLARLAQCYGFDGWLFNIENKLPKDLVPNLLHCLTDLKRQLKDLVGFHAQLIWYDSVTTEGKLCWQNHLNAHNYAFFDVCDGIYLNYGWKAETPAEVAALAGDRRTDVYLGVDVWGRGTYGGGQDHSHVGVQAAAEQGVSVALFAPGWLYEAFDVSTFRQRSDAWWASIRSAWPYHRLPHADGSVASSFCRGYGRRGTWAQGYQVDSRPWHNLGLQQPQPTPLITHLSGPAAAITALAPAQTAPATTTAAPVTASTAPATTTAAPVTASTAPATTTAAPVTSSTAPATTTAAPVTSSTAPATTTAAPVTASTVPATDVLADCNATTVEQWRCDLCEEVAYSGGSCLLLRGPAGALLSGPVLCQLFSLDLAVPSEGVAVALVTADAQSMASGNGGADTDLVQSTAPGVSAANIPPHQGCGGAVQPGVQTAPVLWVRAEGSSSASASTHMVVILAADSVQGTAGGTPGTRCSQLPNSGVPLGAEVSTVTVPMHAAPLPATGLALVLGTAVTITQPTAQSGPHWQSHSYHVPATALPPECTVVGMGVVCWSQHQEAASRGSQAGILLGFLGVKRAEAPAACAPCNLTATVHRVLAAAQSRDSSTANSAISTEPATAPHASVPSPDGASGYIASVAGQLDEGVAGTPAAAQQSVVIDCELMWEGRLPSAATWHVWARVEGSDVQQGGPQQEFHQQEDVAASGVAVAQVELTELLHGSSGLASSMAVPARNVESVGGAEGATDETESLTGRGAFGGEPVMVRGGAWCWVGQAYQSYFRGRVVVGSDRCLLRWCVTAAEQW